MAKKSTGSSDLEADGFKLVANKTIAKGSQSWLDNSGRLHFKEVVPTGSPKDVKAALAASFPGGKAETEFAHNTKVWERELESPGTNGLIKEREVVVEQSHDTGEGDTPVAMPSGPAYTKESVSAPESSPGPSPLQILKNMIDNHDKWLRLLAIGLGVTAVAVAILYGKLFL